VLVWAFVGANFGGISGWLAGRIAGRSVWTAPGPLRGLRLRAVERGEEVFRRITVVAILLTPSWVSGIHNVGTGIYLITNALSAAAWAVGIGLAAYFVGPSVIELIDDLGTATAIGLGALALVAVGFEVRRRWRRDREVM
jgi:membrane protein DedA with SNARE-associated domain